MGIDRCNRGREHITDVAKEEARKDRTATAIATRCGMLELPLSLIYDILLRLPLRAILSCKCVCKTFLEVTRDPFFSEDVMIKSSSLPTKLAIRQGHSNETEHSTFFLANLFDLETSSALPERHKSRTSYSTPCIRHQFTSYDGVRLLGSCHGLLCLMPFHYNTPFGTYYICNPFLGEFFAVPPVTQVVPDHCHLSFARFVFCPKSKQYKIVHFSGQERMSDRRTPTVAEIYTLGSDSWSSTGEVPSPVSEATLDSCLDGVLHWVNKTKKPSELICSLDLETEKFRYVSPPPHVDSHFVSKKMYNANVGVLDGCLCLCYYDDDDGTFDVWVMKNYGEAESWTMEFYIDITPFDKPYDVIWADDFRKPVMFLDNGDLLFERSDMVLVSYHRETETFRGYKSLSSGLMSAYPFVPSLLSLKVIADGKYADSVKRMRKTGFGWTGFVDTEVSNKP